jgi:nucleoside-diphosphate-sugar epimerase
MKHKYLITGGSGFLGSSLARYLVGQGQDVSLILRRESDLWRLKDIQANISIYQCDILDSNLAEIVKKVHADYIFHFASYGVFSSQKDIKKIVDINIMGTIYLMNAIKEVGCKLFIHAGSATEYGTKQNPLKEDDVIAPIFNNYAVVKAATTLFVQKEAINNNLPFITMRIFTPYGPYEDKNRLIPYIVRHALHNSPIHLTNPQNVRDFIYIDDLISAYILATKTTVQPGDIINIGSGAQHTIKEIVNLIMRITSSKSEIIWESKKIQAKAIEPKMWVADITKAKKVLNWKPSCALEKGVSQVIKFFDENKDVYDLS